MKVLDIRDIQREEGFIYYRRSFSGVTVIQLPTKTIESSITFVIEMLPTGKKEVNIDLIDDVDYPVLPLKKALTENILNLDDEGLLP